jgi:hypothetical protein
MNSLLYNLDNNDLGRSKFLSYLSNRKETSLSLDRMDHMMAIKRLFQTDCVTRKLPPTKV